MCHREQQYGELLAPYLDDPANGWVVSSDFCHWGQRFGFTPHDPAQVPFCPHTSGMLHS